MSRSSYSFAPEVYERVLAIVRQRPGINSHNLAMAAGLPPKLTARNSQSYRRINAVLNELEQRGDIRTELIWDMPGQPRRVFAADYQPPPKRPLFQPAAGHQNSCKTWVDPTIRGTWSQNDAPVRRCIDDIPIDSFASTQKTVKTMPKSKYRQQIIEILDKIKLEGKPSMPSMSAICKQVGCAENWFALNPDMRNRYHRIKEQLTAIAEEKPPAEPPQVEVSAGPASNLENLIKADIESLRADLRRIDTEIEQINQDRKSIVIKLNAAIEYLEMRTGEKQDLKLELMIPGNVANGNGKHSVEVMA